MPKSTSPMNWRRLLLWICSGFLCIYIVTSSCQIQVFVVIIITRYNYRALQIYTIVCYSLDVFVGSSSRCFGPVWTFIQGCITSKLTKTILLGKSSQSVWTTKCSEFLKNDLLFHPIMQWSWKNIEPGVVGLPYGTDNWSHGCNSFLYIASA